MTNETTLRASTVMELIDDDKEYAAKAIANAEDRVYDGLEILLGLSAANTEKTLRSNINPNTRGTYHYRVLWWRAYSQIRMQIRVQKAISEAWKKYIYI
jgi:uncharacterized protein (DUF2147 family)